MPSTYYVSAAGNNSNDGLSSGAPKLTVAAAVSASSAGDTISLNGGDTFVANVALTSARTFNSYGTGQATLAPTSTTAAGIKFANCTGTVDNLILAGPSPATPVSTSADPDTFRPAGIEFLNDGGGTTKYAGVSVTRCTITGFVSGVLLYATGGTTSGYSAPTIGGSKSLRNTIHDCTAFGVILWSPDSTRSGRFSNPVVTGNIIHHIPGYSYRIAGIPIAIGFAIGGTVDYNLCHTSGYSATNSGGGPGGIILVYCDGVTGDWDVVHHISKSPGGGDGVGIDHDVGTVNSRFSHSCTHDNDGAGLFYFGDQGGNEFSFNLSINDIRATALGALLGQSTSGANRTFNNTIVLLDNPGGATAGIKIDAGGSGHQFYNNIIWVPSGVDCATSAATGTVAEGNCYYNNGGAFKSWGFASLAAVRGAGLENHGGTPRGIAADPKFVNQINPAEDFSEPYDLPTLFARYKLAASSPALAAGLDLATLFSITMPATDLAGGTLPGSGYSIGAYDAAGSYATTGQAYMARMLARSPVAYNRMNGAGTTLAPVVGGAIVTANATAAQTGALVNDSADAAVSFNGSTSYGTLGIDLSGTPTAAIEFLVNFTSFVTDGDLFESKADWTTATRGLLFIPQYSGNTSTSLVGLNSSGGLKYASFPKPATGWHHIVFWIDTTAAAGSELGVYIDGVAQTMTYQGGAAINSSGNLARTDLSLFSRNNASNFAPGTIQELAVFAAIPDAATVLADYTAATVLSASAAATAALFRPLRQSRNRALARM